MSDDAGDRSRSRSPAVKRERSRSPHRGRAPRPFQGGRRVIIRNIPYDVRWQELKDLFRKEVGDVSYVELLENPDGKSKGVAVVEFRAAEHAKKAIEEYHQYKIKDRAITIREEREKDRQEFAAHSQGMRGDRGGMDPRMGAGPMAGANPHLFNQLGIDGPITNTVFVANLDYKVTWWKLKDVFKLAGNVLKAEIKEDKNGKSRGMGIVVFEHPMEAVQAVSMFNGQTLFDRNMIVRIDKGPEPDKPKLPTGLKSIGMGLGSGGTPLTNFSQLGSNSNYPSSDPYHHPDMRDLVGLGMLGGASDLGLSSLGGMGQSASAAGLGMNLPLDLAGLSGGLGGGGLGAGGAGKLDPYSVAGLGAMGLGGAERLALAGADRLGLGGGRDLGGLMDRIGDMDRMALRDSFDRGSGQDRRESGGGRRHTRPDDCTVMVKNLPYSVNWQALKEHFRDVGDVKFAEIVLDKGKSTGVGYVRFSSESDVQRAIATKHRSRMEKRNIDVFAHRN